MKAKAIMDLMNSWALPELIDDWDNTGFQIGDDNKDVSRILLALDLNDKICQKAIEENFHIIITHHPLIFKPINSITTSNYKEKLIYNLIRNEIVVYNAHTNLDRAEGGVSHQLGKLLGLKEGKPLHLNFEKSFGYGRVGDIEEISLNDYIKVIKEQLDTENVIVYGNQEKLIKRIAVCGGSGAEFIYDAYRENADIYITGDIKYHEAQMADELGLTIIDAGHYHTEKIILPVIKTYLESKSKESLYIEIYNNPSPFYKIY